MPTSEENIQPKGSTRVGKAKFSVNGLQSGEGLSALMHKIGHEIGNPLTSIISMGTVLATISSAGSAPDIGEKVAKYSGAIIDEAWRISRLNERLVMLLSKRSENASAADIPQCAKKAQSKLRSRYKRLFKDLRLELDVEEPSPKPFVDEMQLMLVFSELFTNSMDALNEMQRRHVEENGKAPFVMPPVIVRIREKENQACVEVVSCAAQTCPLELDTVFEPMVTQYDDTKRIGLGLTVCQAIVERFDGSIEVTEERLAEGCLFTTRFYLPTVAKNADESAEASI